MELRTLSNIVLAEEKNKLFPALQGWANALSNLTPEQFPAALDLARQMQRLSDEVADRLRDKLLEKTQAEGVPVGDKGSMTTTVGGFVVSAIPTKTGTDPKKLEAKLRALGLDPSAHMTPTLSFTVDATKLARLVAEGKLTYADVAYNPSYRVQIERDGT